MGRAIRGSSDWCIVMIVGNNITDFLSEETKRAFLSNEARLQIKIGEELVRELRAEGGQITTIANLINQCLSRDDNWKEYYRDRMSELEPNEPKKEHLDRAVVERKAELLCRQRQYVKAAETLHGIINSTDPNDKGWLFQLMATYLYPIDHKESMDKQLKAHKENLNLFRPETGITYSKLTSTGTRVSRIFNWIKKHESYSPVILEVNGIMDKLLWTSPSKFFEQGICELGQILGFISGRPEKETGNGSDNLWNIQGKMYWIIECKNQVKSSKKKISKTEAGQLNNSIGWFKENYAAGKCLPILIRPAKELALGAFVRESFWVITPKGLKKLLANTKKFYHSITGTPFESLSSEAIAQKLKEHNLDINNLVKEYLERGN